MVLSVEEYEGREQAYIKHFFLQNYLGSLLHKTASKYSDIVYVDGFSGPWQSEDENYRDTSFWIALQSLRQAKAFWKTRGRDIRVSAYLVEKNPDAYERLLKVKEKFPDINIITYHGDFVDYSDIIADKLSSQAFVFLFIDPKGWKIPLKKLKNLISHPHSEVVFNFMFDFINRAAAMSDKELQTSLDSLIVAGDWRTKLVLIDKDLSQKSQSRMREEVLIEAFQNSLKLFGNYKYSAALQVQKPTSDRTLYFLTYTTRNAAGIKVFRDCQIKAEKEQSVVRQQTKVREQDKKTSQISLFGDDEKFDTEPSLEQKFTTQTEEAVRGFLEILKEKNVPMRYGDIWPLILEKFIIKKSALSKEVNNLRKNGLISISPWSARERSPKDNYIIQLIYE